MTLRTLGTNVAALDKAYVKEGSAFGDLGKQAGVDNTGATECAGAINTALTSFAALGVRAYAKGTFQIASTVTFPDNADLADATFNYTGTGLAVRVGSATSGVYIQWKTIKLPTIVYANKPTTGWTAGTIGLQINPCYSCRIHCPRVTGFEIGEFDNGSGAGISYNRIDIQHYDNNKINHQITNYDTGWVNENTWLGGRYSHNSNEGLSVSGTRHLYITKDAGASNGAPNNNRILQPSLETGNGIVEFMVDVVSGSRLLIDHARWEANGGATPKVRWGAGATKCTIRGGYNSDAIVQTWVSGATYNNVEAETTQQRVVQGSAGNIWENSTSSANAIHTMLRAGGLAAGDDPTTAYQVQQTSQMWKFKRYTDANDRVRIDVQNGRVYFGDGTTAPSTYIDQATVASIGAAGGGAWKPIDAALIGACGDPSLYTSANQTVLTSGVGYITRVKIDQASAISKVAFYVGQAATSVAAASMDLYDSTGALLGSASLTSVITGTGYKTPSLTTPTSVRTVGEWIYALLWVSFTGTAPYLRGLTATAIPNLTVGGASSRFGTYSTGLAATPGSITPASIAASAIGAQCNWVGVL